MHEKMSGQGASASEAHLRRGDAEAGRAEMPRIFASLLASLSLSVSLSVSVFLSVPAASTGALTPAEVVSFAAPVVGTLVAGGEPSAGTNAVLGAKGWG